MPVFSSLSRQSQRVFAAVVDRMPEGNVLLR